MPVDTLGHFSGNMHVDTLGHFSRNMHGDTLGHCSGNMYVDTLGHLIRETNEWQASLRVQRKFTRIKQASAQNVRVGRNLYE